MNPLNKGDINNISNNDILKSVFSYIDYQRILKVIKNNNHLKERLGISLENYEKHSEMPNYDYKDETKSYIIEAKGIEVQPFAKASHIICTSCLTCPFFFLLFDIYYSFSK